MSTNSTAAFTSTNENKPENRSTEDITINSTITTSLTQYNQMEVATAVGISFGVVAFLFLASVFIYCLRKRGKLKCCDDNIEKCMQSQRRRKKPMKSFNSSNECLKIEEEEEDKTASSSGQTLETLNAPKLARELFSIGDHDNDVPRMRRRRYSDDAADDGYFYDEIFETSAFVDERTNRSIKNLTEDAEFEDDTIPDIVFRSTS